MDRLEKKYKEEVVAKLREKFGYKSIMQVPRLKKIVLNMGLGEAITNGKALEYAEYSLSRIAGQKPVINRAKLSVANFKLRKGMPIGCSVTLRGQRMYEFFDRLVTIALPRVKDFRGVSPKGFDGRGNCTVGIREQAVFPEVNIDKIDRDRGMNITFVTTAKTDEEGRALLFYMGMPFRGMQRQGEQ
ncbi:MAG: 50S ribosomal protein L5 [Candidatus Dadabacteria bacterium]|nr:MAG: 50S ribosomal protein L5 [Candidatus Dadabacteria bacterium]